MENTKSVLIRINSRSKNLLKEILQENRQFKSYGEVLDFFLQGKLTSKAHRLVNTFLLVDKKCTDIASQVPVGKFRADVIGAKLRVGPKDENSKLGHLIETELHLVEIKKNIEEISLALGQILLYKQLIRKSSWVDHLFIYLVIELDEDQQNKVSDEHNEFLRSQGIGLLFSKGAKLEVVIEPKEQTRSLLTDIKNKSILECRSCSSDYKIQEMECKRCGELLKFNIYGDLFKNTSLKLTNDIPESLLTDPVLNCIFKEPEQSTAKLHHIISKKPENQTLLNPNDSSS